MKSITTAALPPDLQIQLDQRLVHINNRLEEFGRIPESEWFYELCFCLLTPQSKAVNAEAVVMQLQQMSFKENGGDVVHILRDPTRYIRFHHQKAKRLAEARLRWNEYHSVITSCMASTTTKELRERRDLLASTVLGFGLKEASHFLRNIGAQGVGILDRHILRYLVTCGVYRTIPEIGSLRQYHRVEKRFSDYAQRVGYTMDQLDLLFWSEMTGFILK